MISLPDRMVRGEFVERERAYLSENEGAKDQRSKGAKCQKKAPLSSSIFIPRGDRFGHVRFIRFVAIVSDSAAFFANFADFARNFFKMATSTNLYSPHVDNLMRFRHDFPCQRVPSAKLGIHISAVQTVPARDCGVFHRYFGRIAVENCG
jgi:hypothetical protein